MIRFVAVAMLGILPATGCERDAGPPIVISAVRVFAPVPGSTNGVAYLTITNTSADTVTITGVRSPQFARVEMHETLVEDGVSRMRPLATVSIGRGERVVFETGGKHLMLIGPRPETVPGSLVTLEIEHDNGLLIVSTTLQDRRAVE